ncbi:MAG: succinate dehydrogenase, hydrophobic membrane anchor protein, partial [Phycisphaerae bacterium]|nr:succinate dehydrogenase, hydrophobic membrane anchor protein [Phycisphaerae bacterium]
NTVHADYASAAETIAKPHNAVLLVLLLICVFYHVVLGLQVVIEDYIQHEGLKHFAMLVMKFIAILFAASAIFSVLRIAFMPAAAGG